MEEDSCFHILYTLMPQCRNTVLEDMHSFINCSNSIVAMVSVLRFLCVFFLFTFFPLQVTHSSHLLGTYYNPRQSFANYFNYQLICRWQAVQQDVFKVISV